MTKMLMLAGSALAAVGAASYAGAQGKAPPPVATYWMDVATQSGFGAGMAAGGKPSAADVMTMMTGGGSSVARTLDLRLASKDKAPAPAAEHLPPAALTMGPSLPLVSPAAAVPVKHTGTGLPDGFQQPKGRMLLYWGCGEHVGPGQPTVIDFAKLAKGQVPPEMTAMANLAKAATRPGPGDAPGYGQWPNDRDSRAVPAAGSLLGAHNVQGNYSPPIAFTLGAGQDFMPALGLTEAGALPSGASRLVWQPAPTATGYALAMFGAGANGDMLVWTSAKNGGGYPYLDYLAPAEVKRLVGTGAVLPPSTSECVLPAEVATASPAGMVTMIGYGPEAYFAEKPKAPKWTAKVRFKTSASLMRGMGDVGRAAAAPGQPQPAQPQPPKKKKRFGLGDVLKGSGIPIP